MTSLLYAAHKCLRSALFHGALAVAYYQSLGFSPQEIALLSSTYWATFSLLQLPSGGFADHYGPKISLIAGGLVVSTAYLIEASSMHMVWFILSAIMQGVGQSMIAGSDSTMIFAVLKHQGMEKRYSEYESKAWTGRHLGLLLGLLGGAAISTVFGFRAVFIASACAMFFGSLVPFVIMKFDWVTPSRHKKAKSGNNYLRHFQLVPLSILSRFCIVYTFDAILPILFQMTLIHLGVSAAVVSVLFAVILISSLMGYYLSLVTRKLDLRISFEIFTLINGAGMALVSFGLWLSTSLSTSIVLLGFSLLGLTKGAYAPPFTAQILQRDGGEDSSKSLSLLYFLGGLAAAGTIYSTVSLAGLTSLTSLCMLLAVAAFGSVFFSHFAHLRRG